QRFDLGRARGVDLEDPGELHVNADVLQSFEVGLQLDDAPELGQLNSVKRTVVGNADAKVAQQFRRREGVRVHDGTNFRKGFLQQRAIQDGQLISGRIL